MTRYCEAVKPSELRRLLDHCKEERVEDDPDLSACVITSASRS